MPASKHLDLIRRAADQLQALEAFLTAETDALQQGRVRDAFHHAEAKAVAGTAYRSLLAEIKDAGPLPPGTAATLRDHLAVRHRRFEQALELNLAMLATLRSVTEGLLRDVAQTVAPQSPAAYGATGRAVAAGSAPVSLSLKT
ncbi:MAG: hypothetical protein LCH61_03565 [Proteobacteria bacterium]|nr:hypothetical protein [Pseudomonadota bacterium]